MQLMKNFFNHSSKKNFTLGLGIVCLLIMSRIKPTLFGFDLEDRSRDHYWEERPLPSVYHGISAEKKLLGYLREQNLITMV